MALSHTLFVLDETIFSTSQWVLDFVGGNEPICNIVILLFYQILMLLQHKPNITLPLSCVCIILMQTSGVVCVCGVGARGRN